MKTINSLSFLNLVILHLILFFIEDSYPHALRRWPRSRQGYSYLANDTACTVDDIVYREGDSIPTGDPCEVCRCRPPGFHCVVRDCPVKPGCKAIRREGECCHDYQCGCEYNEKYFNDGDAIPFEESRCYACVCQGSSITCALLKCEFRMDCEPEYIAGECCPRYDHCRQDTNSSQTDTAEQFDNSFDTDSVVMIGTNVTANYASNSTLGDLQTTPVPKSTTTEGSVSSTNYSSDYRPPSQSFNLSDTKVTVDENSQSQSMPSMITKETNKKIEDRPVGIVPDEPIDEKNVKQLIITVTEAVLRVSSNETSTNASHLIPSMNSSLTTSAEKPVLHLVELKPTKEPDSPSKEVQSVQIEYVNSSLTTKSNTADDMLFTNVTKLDQRDKNGSSFDLHSKKSNSSGEVDTPILQGLKSTPLSVNHTYPFNNETLAMEHGGTVVVQHINNDTIEITNQSFSNDTKLAEIPPTLLEPVSTPVTAINPKV